MVVVEPGLATPPHPAKTSVAAINKHGTLRFMGPLSTTIHICPVRCGSPFRCGPKLARSGDSRQNMDFPMRTCVLSHSRPDLLIACAGRRHRSLQSGPHPGHGFHPFGEDKLVRAAGLYCQHARSTCAFMQKSSNCGSSGLTRSSQFPSYRAEAAPVLLAHLRDPANHVDHIRVTRSLDS